MVNVEWHATGPLRNTGQWARTKKKKKEGQSEEHGALPRHVSTLTRAGTNVAQGNQMCCDTDKHIHIFRIKLNRDPRLRQFFSYLPHYLLTLPFCNPVLSTGIMQDWHTFSFLGPHRSLPYLDLKGIVAALPRLVFLYWPTHNPTLTQKRASPLTS